MSSQVDGDEDGATQPGTTDVHDTDASERVYTHDWDFDILYNREIPQTLENKIRDLADTGPNLDLYQPNEAYFAPTAPENRNVQGSENSSELLNEAHSTIYNRHDLDSSQLCSGSFDVESPFLVKQAPVDRVISLSDMAEAELNSAAGYLDHDRCCSHNDRGPQQSRSLSAATPPSMLSSVPTSFLTNKSLPEPPSFATHGQTGDRQAMFPSHTAYATFAGRQEPTGAITVNNASLNLPRRDMRPPHNEVEQLGWYHGGLPPVETPGNPSIQGGVVSSQIPVSSLLTHTHMQDGIVPSPSTPNDGQEQQPIHVSDGPGEGHALMSADAYLQPSSSFKQPINSPLTHVKGKKKLPRIERGPFRLLNTPLSGESGFQLSQNHSYGRAPAPSDRERVSLLVHAMNDVTEAQDNPPMLESWTRIRQNKGKKIWSTCEELWKRTLQRAWQQNGTPLGDKEVYHEYGTLDDRYYALCEVLRQQKTICKHMLADPYISQVVDDPIQAGKRVVNNRKVNDQKKEVIKRGRESEGAIGQGKGRPLRRIVPQPSLKDDEDAGLLDSASDLEGGGLYTPSPARVSSSRTDTNPSTTRRERRQIRGIKRPYSRDSNGVEYDEIGSPLAKKGQLPSTHDTLAHHTESLAIHVDVTRRDSTDRSGAEGWSALRLPAQQYSDKPPATSMPSLAQVQASAAASRHGYSSAYANQIYRTAAAHSPAYNSYQPGHLSQAGTVAQQGYSPYMSRYMKYEGGNDNFGREIGDRHNHD